MPHHPCPIWAHGSKVKLLRPIRTTSNRGQQLDTSRPSRTRTYDPRGYPYSTLSDPAGYLPPVAIPQTRGQHESPRPTPRRSGGRGLSRTGSTARPGSRTHPHSQLTRPSRSGKLQAAGCTLTQGCRQGFRFTYERCRRSSAQALSQPAWPCRPSCTAVAMP